jgi:hypothetical protein
MPNTLIEITQELILLRKKPTTQERWKSYPSLLQGFKEFLEVCEDAAVLKEVLKLDSGYFLLAGYRQSVIEKLLTIERSPALLRAYAMQLELFGDVDDYGAANLEVEDKVQALHDEADEIEKSEK